MAAAIALSSHLRQKNNGIGWIGRLVLAWRDVGRQDGKEARHQVLEVASSFGSGKRFLSQAAAVRLLPEPTGLMHLNVTVSVAS